MDVCLCHPVFTFPPWGHSTLILLGESLTPKTLGSHCSHDVNSRSEARDDLGSSNRHILATPCPWWLVQGGARDPLLASEGQWDSSVGSTISLLSVGYEGQRNALWGYSLNLLTPRNMLTENETAYWGEHSWKPRVGEKQVPMTFKLLNRRMSETSPFPGLFNYTSQEFVFSLTQLAVYYHLQPK